MPMRLSMLCYSWQQPQTSLRHSFYINAESKEQAGTLQHARAERSRARPARTESGRALQSLARAISTPWTASEKRKRFINFAGQTTESCCIPAKALKAQGLIRGGARQVELWCKHVRRPTLCLKTKVSCCPSGSSGLADCNLIRKRRRPGKSRGKTGCSAESQTS